MVLHVSARVSLVLLLSGEKCTGKAGEHFSRFDFQHFNVENGLSQGTIRAVLQDHNGFIWIGTNDGLNRFDGVEYRTFRHRFQDSTSLSDNTITSLYEDKEKTLWVGTLVGLHRFDSATESFTRIVYMKNDSTRVTEYPVRSIYETRIRGETALWVCTDSLSFVDRKKNELHSVNFNRHGREGKTLGQVFTIAQDRDGIIWMVTPDGLLRVDPRPDSLENVLSFRTPAATLVISRNDADNAIWIGTPNGLQKIDLRQRKTILQLPYRVTSLLEDRNGRLWVGTDTGLILLGQDGSREPTITVGEQGPGSGLTDNYILALCEDASGALWAGTFNGLNRLNEHSPAFTVYRHSPNDANSLGHDFVLPIMEDRKGDIWFGTFGGGVSVLRQESTRSLVYKNYRHDPSPGGFRGNNVRSLLQDKSGNIWIGTDKGLNLYRPLKKSFVCFPTVPPSNANRFWAECLFQSKDGTVWAGTSDLIKIDHPGEVGMTFMRYPLSKDSVQSYDIRVGIEDRRGFLWVGTEKGLVRFDRRTEAYTRYIHNPSDSTSLSHNSVFSIYEDTTGGAAILWVGTGEGLNRFDMVTGKCQRYLEQEGFPSAWVYGILRDDLGRLWLSTNHGLTCFDDHQPEGRKFKNYDVSDGVQGNEFNRRSYCRLRTGEFLFGGTRGVTRFHPLRMRMNAYVPPVVFTSFTSFGKKVVFDHAIAEMSSIVLAFDENDFAFDFVALNFTNPERNRYAYMMEGFDRNWTYCGERRYAHYTHLDPGEYTFKVKASNNDGVWNEQGATVHVSITPPFWGTWWFRLISSASVVAGLYLFYRRRVHAYEKDKRTQQEFSLRLMESQENERKRIAGELHDSLGQNLLVIRNRALLGLKDAELSKQARDQLNLISSVATQAIDEVREISYDLRPYQLDRLGLTKAITSITSGLAAPVQFSMDVDSIDDKVDKDQAIHVYRIVQEGINNILKHSGATEASVLIRIEVNNIRMIIRDNGKGMQGTSPDSNGKRGFGLVGISERAKVLNGTVTIDSSPGQGTTLTVIIPSSKTPS